jgi:hypothetical protein
MKPRSLSERENDFPAATARRAIRIERLDADGQLRMHALHHSWHAAAMKDRARRPDGTRTFLFRSRVSPDARAQKEAAAADDGIPLFSYFEALLDQMVAEQGSLLALHHQRHQPDTELPVADVA